jgi:lysophospholipase L1-like esterase
MRSRHLLWPIIGLLVMLLIVSIATTYVIYNQGRLYYLQLNGLRLDPLGLNHYPITPNQQNLTNQNLTTAVFFGDSRAAQWPAPTMDNVEFINRGIGSQTSEQAVLRFDHHIKPLSPEVIIVQICINDLKTIPLFPKRKDHIIARCKGNIEKIVAASTDLNAKLIVTTIFPIGEVPLERRSFWSEDVAIAIDDVNTFIHNLKSDNVTVFDAYTILADNDGLINPDYSLDLLHLNPRGYERLNQELEIHLNSLE